MTTAIATNATEVAAKIARVRHYSLCDKDCCEGQHNPESLRCDRCGAMIHNDIYEVHYTNGTAETVGKECMCRVTGINWGKSHDVALQHGPGLVAQIPNFVRSLPTFKLNPAWVARELANGVVLKKDGKLLQVVSNEWRTITLSNGRTITERCWKSQSMKVNVSWFSASVARAGHDLGLWELDENSNPVVVVTD